DDAERVRAKRERRDGDVFHLDVRVRAGRGEGADGAHASHEPLQKVDAMDPLVHERAAAVEAERPAPTSFHVILLCAKPLDVHRTENDRSESTRREGAAEDPRRFQEPARKDGPELDAVRAAGAYDGIDPIERDLDGLFHDDVFAG